MRTIQKGRQILLVDAVDGEGSSLMGTGKIKPHPVSLSKVADLRARGFSLSEIGKQVGISKQAVSQLLHRYGLDIKRVESFRKGKALVLHGRQERLIAGITDEDIKKTDVWSRLIAFGVAFDKTQLVENKPTANLAGQFTQMDISLTAFKPEVDEIYCDPAAVSVQVPPGKDEKGA